jgi:hypothetical protein
MGGIYQYVDVFFNLSLHKAILRRAPASIFPPPEAWKDQKPVKKRRGSLDRAGCRAYFSIERRSA